MTSKNNGNLGRTAARIANIVRKRLISGKTLPGMYLPPERELSQELSADVKTVRRALKALEADGLLTTVPRRGYRVRATANDPDRGCPVAFLLSSQEPPESLGNTMNQLVIFLREACERRGWPMLTVNTLGKSGQEVINQLLSARAFGAAVDIGEPDVMNALGESGLPSVLVNAWSEQVEMDSVLQDGQMAGLLAARYLAERGCRRIGWFGPPDKTAHTMDRLSGALAGMDQLDLPIDMSLVIKTDAASRYDMARELLSSPNRPDGMIALWRGMAIALDEAASSLGLAVGRDFHIVGWCPEELYNTTWLTAFNGESVPPAITWSIRTMVELTLSRLVERRDNQELPVVRMKVPVKLKAKP